MGTADQVHVVFLQEARHHVRTKGETNAPVVLTPARDVFVGIRPKEIAEEATVGNLVVLVIQVWKGCLLESRRNRNSWLGKVQV